MSLLLKVLIIKRPAVKEAEHQFSKIESNLP